MAKTKSSSDMNVTAFEVFNSIIGEPPALPIQKKKAPAKNPVAVTLGPLGGLNGAKARAARLSAMRRAQIAQKAAKARWQ